ncbi:MBOAT family O-acyltransferase [Paenibacillus alkalitolerans]|uniref:MBOAT family O-acyltransferase n=1 Tax=Paenibacillus alkalitolerans TaxID=2799335 RepID=UPI0018F32F7B|nr:MBOAT family protein [Paenibacillus alkalitolerans]
MLFNSYQFILLFLPITVTGYFLLNKRRLVKAANVWLAAASLFFYSYWNIAYLPLLLASIAFNYGVGSLLSRTMGDNPSLRKWILAAGVIGDVGLLGYYKYADFFIANYNALVPADIPLLHVILPLGISFFTFTQIAYLVDAYRGLAKEYNIVNYVLFVTFYPHLIAGPILHHKEMMPQFAKLSGKTFRYRNAALGVYLFSLGLAKKVLIADNLAPIATEGFDAASKLGFTDAWITSLAYTFQLYFDFSGYTDMAIGAALLFNIKLPVNFNSPYKSLSIQDFWRRWHMTLSRFLRDYIYIPLGGNRNGEVRTYTNLMLTFLIGGFWHGAGWTFVMWGFLHGFALVGHRAWSKLNIAMPRPFAWFLTFMFVNVTWVFFRADTFGDALKVLRGMFGFNGIDILYKLHSPSVVLTLAGGAIAAAIALLAPNTNELFAKFRPAPWQAAVVAAAAVLALLHFNRISEFLYFNF